MKTCENCYWFGKCEDASKRCEYYDPVFGSENIVLREYLNDLKEREEEYQKVIDEQNS